MGKILVFEFSRRRRDVLVAFMIIMNLVSTLAVLAIFGIGWYFYFYFKSISHLLSGVSLATYISLNLIFSVAIGIQQIGLCYVLNVSRTSTKLMKMARMWYWELLLDLYLITTIVIIPGILLYSNHFMGHVFEGLEEGMKLKMTQYRQSKSDQIVFNNLQFHYQCCGATSYKDWFRIDITTDSSHPPLEDYNQQTVPFSCCPAKRLEFCRNQKMSDEDIVTINRMGCAHVFSQPIADKLYAAIGLWSLVFVLHLITIVFYQYWKSSTETAIATGFDPNVRADGWLSVPYFGQLQYNLNDIEPKNKDKNKDKAKGPKVFDTNTVDVSSQHIGPGSNISALSNPVSEVVITAPKPSPRTGKTDSSLDSTANPHNHSSALMAVGTGGGSHHHMSDGVSDTSDDSDSENDWSTDGYQQYNPQLNDNKSGGSSGGGSNKKPPKDKDKPSDPDKDNPNAKYRERYFILKEVR